MTSRTPMGVQPRPPQRTLSNSGLTPVQRPSQQRTLSGQYLPSSPVRKDNNVIDLTSDTNDAAVAQNRYGTLSRRGGSRLKLEMSSSDAPIVISDSPVSLTPSRPLSKPNTPSVPDASSPASSKNQFLDPDNPPLPMPKRRPRFTLPSASKETSASSSTTTSALTKKDARPKPYVVEVPPAAPRYAPLHRPKADASRPSSTFGSTAAARDSHDMGYADFFPWRGNHPEDRLSDTVIKQGYFDKASVTTAETTSAKSAIFPALKHKNGLNLLSSIFVGVMNQRKHNGQVTTPSTFKPPPRVTLTDTKREMWMRDLANPSISLRRLSRTIPHGIRGKGLLDHCLNKKVPTERAVWLVRCVGANDLRTVKRKGVNGTVVMGGEAKWLRDWTSFVEQFVESVATAFSDPDWKAKVQYAIRLATHIYAEHLVDRDHYMDWLVSGLENSTQARLPMWILVSQMYWKDLLRVRRYGRRLAGALLNQLNDIHEDPDGDILAPLANQLTSLLVPLVTSHSDNFISPVTWMNCREALFAALPPDNATAQCSYREINSRNERMAASANKSQPANRQILIKILDSTYQPSNIVDLATSCWSVSEDKAMILRTVIDWSTSFYRPGSSKVFVGINLLRTWAGQGVDMTAAVLDFMDASPPRELASKRQFTRIVCDLTRHGHFNVRRYLIWLMTRGALRQPSDTEPSAPCSTRLLVDLPLRFIGPSERNTRADLLRRAGYDANEEAKDIEAALKHMLHTMGVPLDTGDPIAQRKPLGEAKICRAIGNSSRALQTEMGIRLAQMFSSESNFLPGTVHSASSMFCLARSILEAAQDYGMLAEITKMVTKFSNPELLASCADTINLHLCAFLSLGTARELCDTLLERLRVVTDEHGMAARPLLMALGNLSARLPGLSNTSLHLRRELHQSDRSTAIDACSPVSDTMAMRPQDAETELHEEIEKLLAGGTSVDRPTMDRLFHTVVSRLQDCWAKDADKQRAYCNLLARLRVFDIQHFDVRMTDWVHHISIQKIRPSLAEVYPFLISLGCLGFSTIFTTTTTDANKMMSSAAAQVGRASTYMQEVLQLAVMPLGPKTPMTLEEKYRFYVQQGIMSQQYQRELAVLTRNAMIEYCAKLQQSAEAIQLPLADPYFQDRLLDLLRLLILNDAPALAQTLGVKAAEAPHNGLLATVTTKLLAPNQDPDVSMSFETVLEMANDFALPFCQLKLSIGLSSTRAHGTNGEEQNPSRVDMLSKALDQAVVTKNMMWTSVLPYLNEEITEHLKKQAQTRFLSLFPTQKIPSPNRSTGNAEPAAAPPPSTEETIQLSGSLLSVLESIMRGRPPLKVTQLNIAMVEKLAEIWETLASSTDKDLRRALLTHWLPALLKLIGLHTSTSEPAPAPATPSAAASSNGNNNGSLRPPAAVSAHDIRARILVVLAGLTLELEHLSFEEAQIRGTLGEAVFDLALMLVDALPDDARLKCIKAMLLGGTPQKPVTSDARLRYLFSYTTRWMEQFMLAHRLTPSQPPSNPNGPPRPRIPISVQGSEKLTPYIFRRWELLSEPTPIVGENDTALSLSLFEAIKLQ